ncbi:HAD family hydrolase [Bailinhaonella thermotolerans]|uniref:HAD family hydrolase n=1 Tax=Bailinhaonella thermotolerans TaxID=1070861 RepID=A0A3A4ASZ0_9ACTN|nr:HAD family hydrolase [Bailinhaonella thermotolerans]RJL33150.1 HAD family hydrolase [Bailinhaonella thermotolerans]
MDTVGFDLDLTLADTRAGIAACYAELSRETGVEMDTARIVARLGPPLEHELAHWFPAAEIPAVAARFRELYEHHALPETTAMPGAHEAVAAVRSRGQGVIVVTGKNPRDAEATVAFLGLDVDAVIGSVFGKAKGGALIEHNAVTYVGDHLGDVDAARAAGVRSIGVATGAYTESALRDYGADLTFPDLTTFATWYTP